MKPNETSPARLRAIPALAWTLIAAVLAVAALAPAASAAPAPAAAFTANGPTNNPFNIWEKFGSSFAVGTTILAAGGPAIAVVHPGRTLSWFPVQGTYLGDQAGNITFANGVLLASTNDCNNATLKSDPNALGTVWTFRFNAGGDLTVVNRRCDQAAGSHGTYTLALTGSSHAGDVWLLRGPGTGIFQAVLTPAA